MPGAIASEVVVVYLWDGEGMKDDLIADIYNCEIGWMQVSKEGRKNN